MSPSDTQVTGKARGSPGFFKTKSFNDSDFNLVLQNFLHDKYFTLSTSAASHEQ